MAITRLLIATTNAKKLNELRELLEDLPVELVGLKDLPHYQEVPEDGKTFWDNAAAKALGYAEQSGLLTLGEDSGLCCDLLEGAPGVYSARFSGSDKDDEANNRKVLQLLAGVPESERGASFKSAVAIAEPGKIIGVVEGEVQGRIAESVFGTGGFGYDPIFYYPPYGKTFGQISSEMKHRVSHRSRALKKAKELLRSYLSHLIV